VWFLFAWACSIPAGDTYPLTGTVLEVEFDTIVVDHDDIDGFMKGMAMSFGAEPSLTRRVQPGDEIRAQLLVQGGTYLLTGLEVTGHQDLALRADNPPPRPLAIGEQLPAIGVSTTIGETTLGAGQGIPTVLTFLFTTCPSAEYCPALATRLAALQPLLVNKARILAITLDPETDTLAVLQVWGAGFGAAAPTWVFGRLPVEQLTPLLYRAGVNRVVGDGPLTHSLVLLALDADGFVRLKSPDNTWDPVQVAQAILPR
jgi:protein SCO1/2